ncbi:glycoside hydrolase [Hortaea werneckii]|uniref:Glycoside hydrolase 35 catalytic domain-containing protein n=1 Tax=Hortaea werneckii TaxID=91943 RepID=A0A3M7HNA1_HORWE|nr:glycoside hydrolase [Hortaea werneckii]KAI7567149.1 glycoside hydrolase [Hortaea werneckii]KAI7618846.1 glycoside hydrolase [Hortaea werneckii]KAI7629814.1 glycoside hydrolase [Hortaea werneckii]KAI7674593.1 glycoside hydrolase [Hortaea werneckii]
MTSKPIPHLKNTEVSQQLIVDGEPFLILGGELQNSSFSSNEYMNEVWPRLKGANYNTIFAAVSWEQIEPVEGEYDFQELDRVIIAAREHGFRLVLLWFGSFKNGLSTYVPPWVKTNATRFPRVELRAAEARDGLQTADILSVFGEESMRADARAYARLMQHVHDMDRDYATVIMVQVENEVGVLGDSRDYGELAEQAFSEPIPDDLLRFLRNDWTQMNETFRSNFHHLDETSFDQITHWKKLEGDPALIDELFMAYHYARYVNYVANAGKQAYPLPMYTNTWQKYGDEDRDQNAPLVAAGGSEPGVYPSGGGVPNVLDIWQRFALSLDFIAPDIYLNDYSKTCAKYRHRNQPLLIPEQRRDEYGALRVWSAFGSYQCLGTAPFGVDTVIPANSPFTMHYALLAKTSQYILAAQARKNASVGFFFDELSPDGKDPSQPIRTSFGDWDLLIERAFVFGTPGTGFGMVIQLQRDEFLLIGKGYQVSFQSRDERAHFTGILRFEEKDVEGGELRTVRLLNGDETRSGKSAVMPADDPDYGGFPVSITIPARTAIAVCQPYALIE